MKYRAVIVCLFLVIGIGLSGSAFSEEGKGRDPMKLYYAANSLYEKGEYAKALEHYLAIVDLGQESGNLYYNAGNCFLKLNKLGYAILSYEKAKRFIPGDGDLKSNLAFARSLTESPVVPETMVGTALRIVKIPFRDLNLNGIAVIFTLTYGLFLIVLTLMIARPALKRKLVILFLFVTAAVVVMGAEFGIRYYEERFLVRGVVVLKQADAKYEPIDKATTYYTVREGDIVTVLKTRGAWRQVKRSDGRVAWVDKGAVQEI